MGLVVPGRPLTWVRSRLLVKQDRECASLFSEVEYARQWHGSMLLWYIGNDQHSQKNSSYNQWTKHTSNSQSQPSLSSPLQDQKKTLANLVTMFSSSLQFQIICDRCLTPCQREQIWSYQAVFMYNCICYKILLFICWTVGMSSC